MKRAVIILVPSLVLSACAPHKVVTSVVTAPFKIVGGTVDALTTSQKEADLKRGRAIRKQEEREQKDARKANKHARKEAKKANREWD